MYSAPIVILPLLYLLIFTYLLKYGDVSNFTTSLPNLKIVYLPLLDKYVIVLSVYILLHSSLKYNPLRSSSLRALISFSLNSSSIG